MEQGTKDWLEFRKDKIGASDAPIIMGVSPYKTPYELWCEKVGLKDKQYVTEYMERGIRLECEARSYAIRKLETLFQPEVLIHPKFRWMIASMDGINMLERKALEIKCPGKEDHQMALDKVIPPKYFPQLQHQLEVTGLDMIYYLSFDGKEGCFIEVERDKNFIGKLLLKEQEFYQSHIVEMIPPDMTDKDFVIRHDTEWENAAFEWQITNENLKFLEEKEKKLRNKLIELSGNKNTKGGGVCLSKVCRRGNINYNDIPELKRIDLEKYRKDSIESWRLKSG